MTLRDEIDDADVFITCPLRDRVVLSASLLNRHAYASVVELLRAQVEGRCRPYGYVRPGSVRVDDIGEAIVDATAMDGSCVFEVAFSAEVCNPPVGSHVRCRVENVNSYGILASNLSECRVLEVILPREADSIAHDIDFDDVQPGAILTVQIAGKRYALGQDTITVIGRAVAHDVQVSPELDVLAVAGADAAEDEEEDVEAETVVEDDDANSDIGNSAEEDEDSESDDESEEEVDDDDPAAVAASLIAPEDDDEGSVTD
jgi:DNA-directed RNA polymerase subunit E'/Rpb7